MTEPDQNKFGIPYKTCDEIRDSFLNFFRDKQHTFVPSANIAPLDDPSLLFTNSGMNQFKAIFLGENKDGLKRVVNSQKCLRVSGKHNDLDEVGRDGTHHTFFEMLGNWSFGDYYKKEAITWAWELLTQVWLLPKERLFVTVYLDDDEAEEIWRSHTDIDPKKIMRFDKDNFWEMGAVGPCGPCSEIHFDMGDLGTQAQTYDDPKAGVNGENQRYIEIWNLVFMQFERLKDQSLLPLKLRHVDTGSGFERICAVIQGKNSNYETDVFSPLIKKITDLTNVPYDSGDAGVAHRVIADHIRALSFAIADGVTPGNEGRAYVMRRILRRASRFAHNLGQKEPFLYRLVPELTQLMGEAFPELVARETYISQIIKAEEHRFLRTLDVGLQKLDKLIKDATKGKKKLIEGQDVFLFHDTYGFPWDLTEIIAQEHQLKIDKKAFEKCMQEQKDRARKAAKFDDSFASDEAWNILIDHKETQFCGYSTLQAPVETLRYREDGDQIYILLDKTPFYAEAGGQIGDVGTLKGKNVTLKVIDTFKVLDAHVHKCALLEGLINPENLKRLDAQVDLGMREKIKRNHSATHILHSALREILGSHAEQQGSLVGPERLRFDFTHHSSLTNSEIERIEHYVNQKIQNNAPIKTEVLAFAEAKKQGALALFGEKYGDAVRVLSMGNFSKELCGGTHAQATGDIGIFRIIAESSIAAGVRRIEAVTNREALVLMQEDREVLQSLGKSLKVKRENLLERAVSLFGRVKDLEKSLANFESQELSRELQKLLKHNLKKVGSYEFIVTKLDAKKFPKNKLQEVLDLLVGQLTHQVAFFTQVEDGQLALLAAVGKGALEKIKAGDLVKELSAVAAGKGGGRSDRARAGSKFPEKEADVLEAAVALLMKKLG